MKQFIAIVAAIVFFAGFCAVFVHALDEPVVLIDDLTGECISVRAKGSNGDEVMKPCSSIDLRRGGYATEKVPNMAFVEDVLAEQRKQQAAR